MSIFALLQRRGGHLLVMADSLHERIVAGASVSDISRQGDANDSSSILLDTLRPSPGMVEVPIPQIALPSDRIIHKPPLDGVLLDASAPGHLLPPPAIALDAVQKWNDPKINVWRILSTFYSFAVMGANDAAYGVSVIIKAPLGHSSLTRSQALIPYVCHSAITGLLVR